MERTTNGHQCHWKTSAISSAFATRCAITLSGRTVRDRHIVLLDTENRNFSVRALIVGLSRATHGSFLHVGDDNSEAIFAGARRVVRQRKG